MKIAVFIAGPYRFSNLVLNSLDKVLGKMDYDVFFHIWKEDLGNKKRIEEKTDYSYLMTHVKTKVFILADPYKEKDYKKDIGVNTNSNSSINATMGMFISMNILSNYLEQLPDNNTYTHIFRLRTDCIIYNCIEGRIVESSNKIHISNNFGIPSNWISDHIMLAPKDKFYLFWKFKSMNGIYKSYIKGNRNPEKTLSFLGKKIKNQLVKTFNRGLDYHIVYNPPKDTDPNCIKKAILENNISYLFDNISLITKNIQQELDIKKLNEKQLQLYSIKNRVKRKIKRIFGK
jgi:hypothetical protein